jgi:hypothetical protein
MKPYLPETLTREIQEWIRARRSVTPANRRSA